MATPHALHDAASTLFPGDVDVLALASTGSGYAIGYRAEAALLKALDERWEVPACSTSQSMVAALRSHHIERISLVHPPWFGYTLSQMGAEYFRSQGFEVIDAQMADLHTEPDQIRPAMVVEWVSQHLSDRAEAVVIGGNGFRAALAIDPLEKTSGRLVLEANQVLLWSVLTSTGTPVSVRGFGTLLENHPNSAEPTTQRGPPGENTRQLEHPTNHVARTTRSHHVPA
jgi:maleate isomerase